MFHPYFVPIFWKCRVRSTWWCHQLAIGGLLITNSIIFVILIGFVGTFTGLVETPSFLLFCLMWTFLGLFGCLLSVLAELPGDRYNTILYFIPDQMGSIDTIIRARRNITWKKWKVDNVERKIISFIIQSCGYIVTLISHESQVKKVCNIFDWVVCLILSSLG